MAIAPIVGGALAAGSLVKSFAGSKGKSSTKPYFPDTYAADVGVAAPFPFGQQTLTPSEIIGINPDYADLFSDDELEANKPIRSGEFGKRLNKLFPGQSDKIRNEVNEVYGRPAQVDVSQMLPENLREGIPAFKSIRDSGGPLPETQALREGVLGLAGARNKGVSGALQSARDQGVARLQMAGFAPALEFGKTGIAQIRPRMLPPLGEAVGGIGTGPPSGAAPRKSNKPPKGA